MSHQDINEHLLVCVCLFVHYPMSVLSYDGSEAEKQGAWFETDRQSRLDRLREREREKKQKRKKRREGPNREKSSTAHQSLG